MSADPWWRNGCSGSPKPRAFARAKARGFGDSEHPFRHQGSADINLYKAFLEQAHALLRSGGRLGFIVPSGLYSDHGTGGLRRLFLDRCQWEWLFGFENRDAIFEIHRSFKFIVVIVQKSGTTDTIRAAFMMRSLEDWERGEQCSIPIRRRDIERLSPTALTLVEVLSADELLVFEQMYRESKLFRELPLKFGREFHMTDDSALFCAPETLQRRGYDFDHYGRATLGTSRLLPLYQGIMIWQFESAASQYVSGSGSNAEWEPTVNGHEGIKAQHYVEEEIVARHTLVHCERGWPYATCRTLQTAGR